MTNPVKSNKLKRLIWLLVAVCAVCAAILLHQKQSVDSYGEENGALYRVYCTTYPVYLFTRQVLRNIPDVSVHLLLPPNTGCPHDYSLTPKDLMKLSYPKTCLVCNGQGLDDAICAAAKKAYPNLLVIDSSREVDLIAYADEDNDDEEEEEDHAKEDHKEHAEGAKSGHHHHHHTKNGINPHFFASPSTADDMVRAIRDAFIEIAPEYTEQFRDNAGLLLQEFGQLSDEFRQAMKFFKSKKIAVQHDVFAYLARDFGLKEAVIMKMDEHQALSPNDITCLAKEIREKKVRVIFTEPQYQSKYAELVAKEAEVPCSILDPVATGPKNPPKYYYVSVMRENLARLQKYLGSSSQNND